MAKVCVIIVTYNGMKWAKRCFDSLFLSTIPIQAVVIDNGSTDGTQEYVKTNYPQVHFIQSEKNLGFGKANNIGFRYAIESGCDYVYLLNQDAWVENNTLEILLSLMSCHSNYAIISPLQLTGNGGNLDYNFQLSLSPQSCPKILSDAFLHNYTKTVYPTDFVMAAHWMIRLNSLMSVGGFMPLFEHYGEDNNLIHRIKYHGWTVGVTPQCSAYHDREYRSETNENKMRFKYVEYLVRSANINQKGKLTFLYFLKYSISIIISTGSFTKKITFIGKMCGKLFIIFKYRKESRFSNSQKYKWI